MITADFRSVFLPYCLKRLDDGRYVVLNRKYKPIGFFTSDHVDYSAYPIAVHIEEMTPDLATTLSWNRDPATDCIYLYNDGTNPINDAETMLLYSERVKLLMKLRVGRG